MLKYNLDFGDFNLTKDKSTLQFKAVIVTDNEDKTMKWLQNIFDW